MKAGFDKTLFDFATSATGAAGAALAMPLALIPQALNMGMGMVQTVVAMIVDVVPPLIPPPVWNNMPLPCVPMVLGHNCFGAVLHPITMPDFVLADKTDKMMDGYISGFPALYAEKV